MGIPLPLLIPLFLLTSTIANPIPLERATSTDKLSCENKEVERCLLFPIGCTDGVDCTDRLEMRRVQEGSNVGDIIISLNLHVSRTSHMLVAVPLPDISNPNSTFLVGCSIDDALAVVAKPDVDGVTEQLQVPWLRLVAVRATSEDLECVVTASSGYVDLPVGDVAVFAGDLQPEEEIHQSAGVSLDEEKTRLMEERREEEERGDDRRIVHVQSTIQKISPPLPQETTRSLEHNQSVEPVVLSVEGHSVSTPFPVQSTTISTTRANRLRLKMLHSSESSSGERLHRHSSEERTHSTHASLHHETPSTTTVSTPVIPKAEESTASTTETTSTTTHESSTTVHASQQLDEEDLLTTVHPSGSSLDYLPTELTPSFISSHERDVVDKEEESMEIQRTSSSTSATTTTTEKTKENEDDDDIEVTESEKYKHLLRELEESRSEKEEGREEEEEITSLHFDSLHNYDNSTAFELIEEEERDHVEMSNSQHSHESRAVEEEKEEETTMSPVRTHEEVKEKGVLKDNEISENMAEKRHEFELAATSSLSLTISLIVCLMSLIMD